MVLSFACIYEQLPIIVLCVIIVSYAVVNGKLMLSKIDNINLGKISSIIGREKKNC